MTLQENIFLQSHISKLFIAVEWDDYAMLMVSTDVILSLIYTELWALL